MVPWAEAVRLEAVAVRLTPADDDEDRVEIARGSSAKRIVEVVVEVAAERFCCWGNTACNNACTYIAIPDIRYLLSCCITLR